MLTVYNRQKYVLLHSTFTTMHCISSINYPYPLYSQKLDYHPMRNWISLSKINIAVKGSWDMPILNQIPVRSASSVNQHTHCLRIKRYDIFQYYSQLDTGFLRMEWRVTWKFQTHLLINLNVRKGRLKKILIHIFCWCKYHHIQYNLSI